MCVLVDNTKLIRTVGLPRKIVRLKYNRSQHFKNLRSAVGILSVKYSHSRSNPLNSLRQIFHRNSQAKKVVSYCCLKIWANRILNLKLCRHLENNYCRNIKVDRRIFLANHQTQTVVKQFLVELFVLTSLLNFPDTNHEKSSVQTFALSSTTVKPSMRMIRLWAKLGTTCDCSLRLDGLICLRTSRLMQWRGIYLRWQY